MESYWILGAGRFGSLAVGRLLKHKRNSQLIVVDRDSRALQNLALSPAQIIEQDAIEFLSEHPGLGNEWVVPAIPVHVAFVWLCRQLAKAGRVSPVPVPCSVEHRLPNPLRDETGTLYASFAPFRCPDDCDEPPGKCTVTGNHREANLFDIMRQIEVEGYVTRVVRSHQLTLGVGGYRLSVLWSLLEEVRSTGKDFLVATSCRCHAVVNALRWHRTIH
jgi:hypothetical protein